MKAFDPKKGIDPALADALYELGNVGVGKATSALGKMTGQRVTIGVPKILAASSDIEELSGVDPDTVIMGILMRLEKNLGGAVMILVDNVFMSNLVYKLTGKHYPDEELLEDEDSLSAIQEVANIMAASYMTAIGAYTGLRIYLTPVMVGIDMAAALLAYPIAELCLSNDEVICIDVSFHMSGDDDLTGECDGRIVMLPDVQSLQLLADGLNL